MEDFLNELEERLEILKKQKPNPVMEGRISELMLVIVRVQQIILLQLNVD